LKFVCENYRVNGNPVGIPFVVSTFSKEYPQYADAMFKDGRFNIELGKPNAKPLTEGNGVNYRILYEAE